MINPSDASFFPALQHLLSWTSKRQQALAGNVANMDTPGYQARDYSFEQELATMNLTTTAPNLTSAQARPISSRRATTRG